MVCLYRFAFSLLVHFQKYGMKSYRLNKDGMRFFYERGLGNSLLNADFKERFCSKMLAKLKTSRGAVTRLCVQDSLGLIASFRKSIFISLSYFARLKAQGH